MDTVTQLKNAIEFAKQNPDAPQSVQLRRRIESGMYDNELKQIQMQSQPQKTAVGKVAGAVGSVLGGIAHGVAGSALTAEDYLAKKAVNAFGTEQMKQNLAQSPSLHEQFKQQVGGTENPTTYNIANLAGEVAALGAPVSAVGRTVGTATKAALEGTKAAKYAGTLGKVAQAATEGVAFTAGHGITQGENQSLKDFAVNAGINVAFPVVGAGIKQVGSKLPERIVNSLIKPLQKDFAYGKNPGKTVAEMGIVGNNFDELITNIKSAKQMVGQNIGTTIEKSLPRLQSQLDLNTYLSPIDEALAIANKSPRTNATVISRLEAVKADLVDNINRGIDPQSFKGLVGDLTRWTGNASEDTIVNKSLKQVYGKTQSGMDDVLKTTLTPEEFAQYKKSAEQYGNLISAENAAVYRNNIVQRSNLISWGAKNTALIGAIAAAVASGGTGLEAILAGVAGGAIDTAMATPAFKTRLASLLSKLGPKEVQTFFDKVPGAKQVYKQEQIDSLVNQAKKNLKNPSNAQGGFINLGGKSDDLINEAKKYKSAEEFIKAQGSFKTPYDWNYLDEMQRAKDAGGGYSHSDYSYLSKLAEKYRGKEPSEPFFRAGSIEKSSLGEKLDDIYLTDNEGLAQQYANNGETKVNEYRVLAKNPLEATSSETLKKILGDRYNELPNSQELKKKLIKYAKDKGYDSVRFPDSGPDGEGIAGNSLVVFDKSLIKTKSQLEEIWKKANKK